MQELQQLMEQIHQLEIDSFQKEKLLDTARKVAREQDKTNFKLQRFEKDRSISVKLLEASVDDLQMRNKQILEKNMLLEEKTIEIEEKNFELEFQKNQLKENTQQLQNHLHQLEMSYDDLKQFSFVLSHDLKTPLRTITSFAQLLEKTNKGKLDIVGQRYLDFIVDGVTRMNTVLDDLGKYLSYNDSISDRRSMDELCNEAVYNLQGVISDSKAEIVKNNLPVININPKAIIFLFQELIGNGIKFAKDGTRPTINIFAERIDHKWVFSVKDNGTGLDEIYAEKVFQAFQKIDTNKAGTGIGLALCKKIVHQHGGDIWYTSDGRSQTTFYFSLPE